MNSRLLIYEYESGKGFVKSEYYEEKLVNGKRYFRRSPVGVFKQIKFQDKKLKCQIKVSASRT